MNAKWSVALLGSILMGWLSILPASAALTGLPAGDGDGLMDVSPTNLTYGSSSSFVFTFTANNDFGPGSSVELNVPTGWSAPTTAAGAGHVSVSSGTCTFNGSPGWQITGRTIIVDLTSCLTGASFTINYSGSSPGVTGSPFTFLTQTDIGPGGGGLTTITAGSPAVTIDPKALTVSGGLTPTSKVYNGTTAAGLNIGAPTLVGVIGSDIVALDATGATAAFADRNVGTAKPVSISGLVLTGAQAVNYTITPPARFANITPRAITITAVTDSKVYDGTTVSSGLPTLTGGLIQAGDIEPVWTQTFNSKHVGANKILTPAGVVNDGNSGANYSYTYAVVSTGAITKLPITVTAVTNTKTYDGTTSAVAIPSNSGIAPGDSASFTESYGSKSAGTGKTLMPAGLVTDGNAGNNYSYTYNTDNTGVILPKSITVSPAGLTPNNKVYDGTTAASGTTGTPTLVGVISPDAVSLVTTGATYTFADRNAGSSKVVHVTGLTLGGAQAGNYSLSQPDRTASITKRAVAITAVNDNRAYDGTNHSSGLPSLTGGAIQPGDLEPVWTQTFNNKHVGTGKSLTPAGAVVDGNSGNNYSYTFIPVSTGVITPRVVTVTAISDTKIYDGTTHSADIPNYAPVLVGSDTPGFTQAFNTKDVGTGRTLSPSGVVNDGNGGNNYSYTYVPDTTGVITVRAITVSAVTDSKVYDGTTVSAGVPNISPPLFGTDTAGFTQSFDTKDSGTGKVLTATGVVNDGNGGADYSVTFMTDNHGVVLAKAITVTANSQSKPLGALDPELTYTASPALIAPDIFTGLLTRDPGEVYGNYAIHQGSLAASSNYSIAFVGANLLIGPAISGNAGVGGAVLSYTDGVLKAVTADGAGNYSLVVASGWTGTVTPALSGYAFVPASIPYNTPVTSDLTGQNYTAHALILASFTSAGPQDGWILETGENTTLGGTLDAAATTFRLGDDAAKKQYRAILSFNTGALPDTAVITTAALKLRRQSITGGGNPFSIFQGLYVDVRKGYFGASNALQAADFQATASKPNLGPFNPTPVGTLYTITLPAGAYAAINKQAVSGGLTQVRLRFKLDDNNNVVPNYISFFSGNYGTATSRPILTITYYLP